jgi:hypothetical protein
MTSRRVSLRLKSVSARDSARFAAMAPLIRKQVRFVFRFSPIALRQERVDDALAHAFVLFAHLVRRKRIGLAHPTALARYAIHRVRSGRPIGSRMNRRDVLSPRAQRQCGFRVISADTGCWSRHAQSTQLLAESRQTTPAELAAIRIDFASWLDQLSDRQRRIALCLALGEPTGTVAQQFHVSCARISQIRLELATLWRQFQGELQQGPHTASWSSRGNRAVANRAASTPCQVDRAPLAAGISPTGGREVSGLEQRVITNCT